MWTRKLMLPAYMQPWFDLEMDKLIERAANGDTPEGFRDLRPNEVLEITVRRVQAQRTA